MTYQISQLQSYYTNSLFKTSFFSTTKLRYLLTNHPLNISTKKIINSTSIHIIMTTPVIKIIPFKVYKHHIIYNHHPNTKSTKIKVRIFVGFIINTNFTPQTKFKTNSIFSYLTINNPT